LAKGLRQLETFEGDVLEAYDRTFQVEYESFGQMFQHDLVPDGVNIPLTNANRGEFIQEYLKFYFTTSIAKQFNAFSEGFHLVTLGSAIQVTTITVFDSMLFLGLGDAQSLMGYFFYRHCSSLGLRKSSN
jgi:hypothetical protein